MIEDPKTTTGQAVTVQRTREVRVVEDIAPLFDTARFEHYGRIAAVMAQATLIPDAIRGASREEAVGNCFMVVSLADRLGGFDPWAVAACCSVLHGKLMVEAKLVHAAIKRKLGIDLFTYYVGEKGHEDFRVYICDEELPDEVVAALEPGKAPRGYRVVDGSVKEWRTYEKGGAVKSNWTSQPEIQLFYRGTRTWQRRYEPAVMLGIYTDDEMEHLEARQEPGRRVRRDLAAKLTNGSHGGEHGAEGFDRDHVARETGEETKPAAETQTVAGGEGDDAVDAEVEEIDTTTDETSQSGQDGSDAAAAASVKAEAETKLQPLAEEFARISPQDEPVDLIMVRLSAAWEAGETVSPGHAEAGEKYLIAGEGFNEAGRRLAYLDGARFSAIGGEAAGKLKVYAIHGPLKEEEGEKFGELTRPTETGGVPLATSEPATSETATDASGDGARQAEASGPSAQPADADQDPAPEGGGFLATLRPLTKWKSDDQAEVTIKSAFAAMNKTSDWMSADPADQDELRRMVWAEVERVRADHGAKVDQAQDVTAFGLWMPTQPVNREGADAVEGTFNALQKEEVFQKMSDANKAKIGERVDAFLKRARGQ